MMRFTFWKSRIVLAALVLSSLAFADLHGQAPATPKPKPSAATVQKPTPRPAITTSPNATAASEGMTNLDVLQMVTAKLADDIVVNAIEAAPKKGFDLSPTGLVSLKKGGVSDEIIRVMQGKPRALAAAPQRLTPSTSTTATIGPGETAPSVPSSPTTEQQKGNAVGRFLGGVGRAIHVTGKDDSNDTVAAGASTNLANKGRKIKNGEPGVFRTSLAPNVAVTKIREFLESNNSRTEVVGETVKTDWGTPEKCPGFTAAQCQARVDVQVRAGANGVTTVSIWVVERRRNRGTNNWGERGAIGDRTEKLTSELEGLLVTP